jgi:hypothetical protein
MHIGFQWESHMDRDHYVLDIGGRMTLKWILRETGWGGMDWIDLAQDRDQWRSLVNMVISLQVP